MRGVLTSGDTAARRARRSVELTRAQSICVALLIFVPLPAFSLGALVMPLPQLMERAAAGFIPFASHPLETVPEPVVAEEPVRAPRGRRSRAQRPTSVSSSSAPTVRQARHTPVPARKRTAKARVAAPAQAAPSIPAPTPAREAAAPSQAPAATAATRSSMPEASAEKSSKKDPGRHRKEPKSTGDPASAGPAANSGPGENSGHGNEGGNGGGPGESNAAGNGNSGNGGGGSGGGSGKDTP